MAFIVLRHHALFALSTPQLSPLFSKTPFDTSLSHFSYSCYAVYSPNPFSSESEGVEIERDTSTVGVADEVNLLGENTYAINKVFIIHCGNDIYIEVNAE